MSQWNTGLSVWTDGKAIVDTLEKMVIVQILGPLKYFLCLYITTISWDLYVKSGDKVVNAKGRANEMGQCWCPADLLDFQLSTTGTSQSPPIDPMQTQIA